MFRTGRRRSRARTTFRLTPSFTGPLCRRSTIAIRKPFADAVVKPLAPSRCVFLTGDLGFQALEPQVAQLRALYTESRAAADAWMKE